MNKHADIILNMARSSAPDLSIRQLSVLLIADDKENLSVKDFANDLLMSKPSVSRAVDRLVDLFLVTRVVDQADRRKVCVRLTKAGRDFTKSIGNQQARAA